VLQTYIEHREDVHVTAAGNVPVFVLNILSGSERVRVHTHSSTQWRLFIHFLSEQTNERSTKQEHHTAGFQKHITGATHFNIVVLIVTWVMLQKPLNGEHHFLWAIKWCHWEENKDKLKMV